MKMTQKAGIAFAALASVFAASVLSLKAKPLESFTLLDKQPVDKTLSMPLDGSTFRIKTNNPVQGPYTPVDTLEYSAQLKVAYNQPLSLGLGEAQMRVVSFDLQGQKIILQAMDSTATIQTVILQSNGYVIYDHPDGEPIWGCKLKMSDKPETDGSYKVQMTLTYARGQYTPNKMDLDTVPLPLGMEYITFGGKQVKFFYNSLPASESVPIKGEYVEMTTNATYNAIRVHPYTGNGYDWDYPNKVLISHTHYQAGELFQDMYSQNSSSDPFYKNVGGVYIHVDTTDGEWMAADGAPTYPDKNDPTKRGTLSFTFMLDSASSIFFRHEQVADSTNQNHIFFPVYPKLWLTVNHADVATSTSEIKYNYSDVKIEAPDEGMDKSSRITYTINSGDLFGTWNRKDTLVPTDVPEQTQKQNLLGYPNPAGDRFTIQGNEYLDNATVKIYNVYGIEVEKRRMDGNTFSTEGLVPGAYYGVVNDERFRFIKR